MMKHEDLIAQLRNHSGVRTADVNERVALMDEAANVLEKVTTERDRLDEAFDRDLPWRYAEVEAQRNQLAAVVERVREYLVAIENSPGLGETGHHRRWLASAQEVVASPSVALDRVKAEAVRVARDAIMPPVNCELRYDGTEDPGAAEYVGIMHEVHDRLSDHADRIEKGESNE